MNDFLKNKVSVGVFLFFLFFGILNIFYGEKTEERGGFFYDGSVYADITIHFEDLVFRKGAGFDPYKHDSDQFTHGISDYLLQRTAPLALVHYSLKAFDAEFTNENVIRGFEIWNLVYLLISIIAWHFIVKKLNLNSRMQLVSYVLIFANFAFLKLNFFYPVLTDTPAFMLMMLTFLAWLNNKPLLQLGILFVGAFTWPSFFYISGILLFFMPNKRDDLYDEMSFVKLWATPLFAIIISAFLYWVFYIKHENNGLISYFEGEWGAEKINRAALPISLTLLMVYLCTTFYNLFKLKVSKLLDLKLYLTKYHIIMGIVLLLLFVTIKFIIKYFQGPETVSGMKLYTRNVFLRSCTDPLTFLVSNIQYFGVIMILLVFSPRSFIRNVHRHGPGAVLIMAMITIFSINSESRQLTYIIPILCYFMMPRMSELHLSKGRVAGLIVCAFILSKSWLPLNHGVYLHNLTEFPDQWYFMNMGPWMSHQMYWVFATSALSISVVVWFLVKPSKTLA